MIVMCAMGLNFFITVKQKDCMTARLYKTSDFYNSLSVPQMERIGIDFNRERGDEISFDVVSDLLYDAIPAQWVRESVNT